MESPYPSPRVRETAPYLVEFSPPTSASILVIGIPGIATAELPLIFSIFNVLMLIIYNSIVLSRPNLQIGMAISAKNKKSPPCGGHRIHRILHRKKQMRAVNFYLFPFL